MTGKSVRAFNFIFLLPLLLLFGNAVAQPRIEEIVVTAPPREQRALQPAVVLTREQIAERAPVSFVELFEVLPSLGMRTNSRGEVVLRLRGSEERQTGIFLDGAPLSVPWDGRVDLSALPTGIVERVQIIPSAAPIEYGPNSVLGVIDIQTPIAADGLHSVHADAATAGARTLSAVGGTTVGGANLVLGGTYRTRDGEVLSDPAAVPFSRTHDGLRDNTDLSSRSLFAAAATEKPWGAMRLSLLSVDAERGVAAVGSVDPAVDSPRYWRYPRWRFNQLTLNSSFDIGAEMTLRSTLWFQHFEQTIDQHVDDTYEVVGRSEDGEDLTTGTRLVVERPLGAFDVRFVGAAQTTTHEQLNSDRLSGVQGPVRTYRQDIFSLGAEIDVSPAEDVNLSAATSYDLATTPRTGGREAQNDLSDWAFSLAARWNPDEDWQIAGSLGQRTRFPSLRELYGEALGKFLLNPELEPESALLGDVTFTRTWADDQFRLRVTPWYLRIDNTLSQRSVLIDGLRLRQRYNLNGSDGYGLEWSLRWQGGDRLEFTLNGNWQNLRARREDNGSTPVLYQRPDFQSSLVLDWIFAADWDLFWSIQHLSTAFDEDEHGVVVKLPPSTRIDIHLFRTMLRTEDGRWRIHAGIDNVTDELVLPQLGLPMPGRTLSIGISFEKS